MIKDENFIAFMDEVYDIDEDRSTGYLIQHLTDTVNEYYSMKNKRCEDAHGVVMEYLINKEDT